MSNLDLIIQEKQAELDLLKSEMQIAVEWEGDLDYEYAALLNPIIIEIQEEIRYYQHLKRTNGPENAPDFITCLRQFMKQEWKSLDIAVEIKSSYNYSGPVIQITKMKTKNKILCSFSVMSELARFLHYDVGLELIRHGWSANRSGTVFTYKTKLKKDDDLISFHKWISATLLGPLKELWSYTTHQYYVLNKE